MSTRHFIGRLDDFPPGEIKQIGVDGTMLIVARVAPDRVCAVLDECSHLLLSLCDGRLSGHVITCPHHHSSFDLCTGANLDWVRIRAGIALPRWSRRLIDRGSAPPPLHTVPVLLDEGDLYVEL